MNSTQLLEPAAHLMKLRKCLLWAMLVGVALLNVSSVFSTESTPALRENAHSVSGQTDCEQLRKTVQQLTADVEQLRRKVADLDKYRQIDYLRDQLMKEEQRSEVLQTQIQDVIEKQAPLESRIDQIDEQMRPENIDQALAGVGSMRPEEAKESLRRRLGNEKRRVQTQLDSLRQNQARLQAALASAEASIQRLRLRLSEATRP